MLSTVLEAIIACMCMCVIFFFFFEDCVLYMLRFSGPDGWADVWPGAAGPWQSSGSEIPEVWSLASLASCAQIDPPVSKKRAIQQCTREWQTCSLLGSLTAGNVLEERNLLSPNCKPHQWSFDSIGHSEKSDNLVNNVLVYATCPHSQAINTATWARALNFSMQTPKVTLIILIVLVGNPITH